jgi:hypothetical protein
LKNLKNMSRAELDTHFSRWLEAEELRENVPLAMITYCLVMKRLGCADQSKVRREINLTTRAEVVDFIEVTRQALAGLLKEDVPTEAVLLIGKLILTNERLTQNPCFPQACRVFDLLKKLDHHIGPKAYKVFDWINRELETSTQPSIDADWRSLQTVFNVDPELFGF